ncbi:MAG: histidinol-phosphatase HisJ family protein [Clostridia bacterium]|nr:histidinol-phosphatase HisJ family protein [Clostridia bacterium]MBR0509926.1 histidinol-phosphatase HisJ family protein [Clostridia bacterium]MBR0537086.1 histidinol-phosphatase HisJ family protein [Clostridia bacterium]
MSESDTLRIRSNIHTHTTFSDGKHTPDEMAQAAIAKGFETLGISDHSFTFFDVGYCLPREREPAYREAVLALKEAYRGRLEICCGMELDRFSDPAITEGLDYFICGVHYVYANGVYHPVDNCAAATERAVREGCGGDESKYVRLYYEAVADCIALKPLYVAHLDLLTKFSTIDETSAFYRKTALETLDALLDAGMPIEVNTGAMARGAKDIPYPSFFLLRRVAERNGSVIFGSDCHDRAKLDYAFADAMELVKAAGVRRIVEYRGGALQPAEP